MKHGYHVKDAGGATAAVQSNEPDVVKAVELEIKKLGDNVKANYDELQNRYNEMKQLIDGIDGKADTLVKAQIAKLSEEISTRQKSIDDMIAQQKKDLDTRIDSVEVAMKRLPKAGEGSSVGDQLEREIKQFFITTMANDDRGATVERVALAESKGDFNPETFANYKKVFNRYLRTDEKLLNADVFKALSVGIDPNGGYTVVPAMSDTIIKRLYETDPVRQLCNVETISTGALEILVDWGDAGADWEGETVANAESTTPTWNKKRIPVHVLSARPRATQTLIEDSMVDIEAWLSGKVADKMSRVEAAAFVSGNGVGKPTGFLSYANGTTWGTIQWVAMGAASTLVADGVIDTKYALKEYFLSRGVWLVNRLTVSELMQLKDGAGNYLWKPGFARDEQATLLGLPVRMSTTMPVVATSSRSLAIADWKEAYTIVDRTGITVQRDPYTAKPFVEFYTRKRVGGDVVNFDAIKIGYVHT